jgi:hypothetical protein
MSTEDQILDAVDFHVNRVGNAVQGVFDPDGKEPTYAYTIGNCTRGMPELIMSGLPPEVLQALLNDASRMMREGTLKVVDHLVTGELAQGYNTVFRLVKSEIAREQTGVLNAYCRWKHLAYPEVFQLVFPDTQHRFPWDADCEARTRRAQPVWYEQGN